MTLSCGSCMQLSICLVFKQIRGLGDAESWLSPLIVSYYISSKNPLTDPLTHADVKDDLRRVLNQIKHSFTVCSGSLSSLSFLFGSFIQRMLLRSGR